MACRHGGEDVVDLGVDQEHRGLGVLHDVLDLVGSQAEVDGDEDPAEAADPEERREQAGGVGRDDGDPLTRADAQPVETGGLEPGTIGELGEGQRRPGLGRLVGLVDEGNLIGVGDLGPIEEVTDIERNEHRFPLRLGTGPRCCGSQHVALRRDLTSSPRRHASGRGSCSGR